jgi:3'-phosphoadenosine 5'-phosphosulfate sulfotransferase (PAPS reductase)/FAD synthetase
MSTQATLPPETPAEAKSGGGVVLQRLVRHLVLFSGGLVSWATAKRVVEKHGTDGVVLLFADTMMEDEDLYRFIVEAAENVGVPLTRIADGRNPWEVMRDERIIGGGMTGADPCSKILKRQLLDRWTRKNCQPETVSHVGLDWTEHHRLDRMRVRMPERKWSAPMTEAPYLTKPQMMDWLKREGIEPPRLYKMGFPHNNCGGFCIKAGQAHFELLLRMMPDRYAHHEQKEEEMRQMLGKDYAVLREQRDGNKYPLTLRKLRERIQSQGTFDQFEWGGCGCAIDA